MLREINYPIRFTFPRETQDRENLFSSIEFFFDTMSEMDRIFCHSIGLPLAHYSKSLREMSANYFYYEVKLKLSWPGQLFLGRMPSEENMGKWIDNTHKYLLNCIGGSFILFETLVKQWNNNASSLDITDNIVYKKIEVSKIKPIVTDLAKSVASLGGINTIEFSG